MAPVHLVVVSCLDFKQDSEHTLLNCPDRVQLITSFNYSNTPLLVKIKTCRYMQWDWPLAQFAFSLLEVLQLLHAVDLLLDERRFVLPRVVDVRPALPLDEVLHLACFLSLLEAGVRIAVIQSIVVSSATAHSYKKRIMTKKLNIIDLNLEVLLSYRPCDQIATGPLAQSSQRCFLPFRSVPPSPQGHRCPFGCPIPLDSCRYKQLL